MKIIVLNYTLGCIDVLTFPIEYGIHSDDIESRLANLGYNLENIEWMMSREDGTPVFYNNDECPTYTL